MDKSEVKVSAYAVYKTQQADPGDTATDESPAETTLSMSADIISDASFAAESISKEDSSIIDKETHDEGGADNLNFSSNGITVSTKKRRKIAFLLREAVNKKKKKKRKLSVSSAKKVKSKADDDGDDNNDIFAFDGMEDIPFINNFKRDNYDDSRTAARDLFSMMVRPVDIESFFRESWEKRPVLVRRHKHRYNEGWFSTQELDKILRENHLEYTKNIDVTTYENGARKTHNLDGRATAAAVWDFYKNGCSVRLLNPQSYSKGIWLLNSTLQELFGSCMGANVYLTPAGTQGFAPHYDDIEAFVMQLEGRKRWKLYGERTEQDRLPRYSSRNLSEKDLGEPVLEAILEPGDLLYFPRGTIHQAATLGDEHSLHITISTFQRNSWADLMEKVLPTALEVASNEDPEFRSGLPLNYLQYMGVVFSDSNDPRRADFFRKFSNLFAKLSEYLPIDAAVDQMGSEFIHGCLPPCETPGESSHTACIRGDKWEGGRVVNGEELTDNTRVKLIRYGVVRLVMEKDGVVLFTTATNSRLNSGKDKCGVYIDGNEASGIDYLIQSYPNYVTIASIPLESDSTLDKIDFCYTLFLQGVLMIDTSSKI